jgi:putative solute:sodium symporter small subunit
MSPGDRDRPPGEHHRPPGDRGRPPGERERRRVAFRSPRQELAESTEHGAVYLRRLRHAQLQLSLLALVAFGALFGVLPIALYLLPELHRITFLGVPLQIWILVVPLFPLFIAIGWLYARRADALDAAFRELVEK